MAGRVPVNALIPAYPLRTVLGSLWMIGAVSTDV
jgi:hypothetical protein